MDGGKLTAALYNYLKDGGAARTGSSCRQREATSADAKLVPPQPSNLEQARPARAMPSGRAWGG